MKEKKKLKLRKFNFHPTTTFILLTMFVIVLSWFLSKLNLQATYSIINSKTGELETEIVTVKNLLGYDGVKYIIGNAAKNFASFTPLSTLLIALIGLSVAYASGLIDTFIKRITLSIDNKKLTFLLILIAIFSSLINEVGYVILIPLAALVFLANGRSPLLGITAAFCGVSFGYGATFFAGPMDINLISSTIASAHLIDPNYHVALTSNIFILIASSIIIAIVGTIVIEKIIINKLGKYKKTEETYATREINTIDIKMQEQSKLETEVKEKKGMKRAAISGIIILLIFIYMIIPGLPASGMLLDNNAVGYVNQLFGTNSYFQDGFTYMVSIFFIVTGIAYATGAKTLESDKDLIETSSRYLKNIGHIITIIFFASQFIAIFKETNIGTLFVAWGASLIKTLSFTGIPLIILVLLVLAVLNLFVATPITKWQILSPVVVPLMMQSNISPEFAQFIFRAGDSITKGISPLLAYFVIFLGYLNIYNKDKNAISIRKAISYIMPYCLIIGLTWILIIIGWYLIGLPIGPGVSPTL